MTTGHFNVIHLKVKVTVTLNVKMLNTFDNEIDGNFKQYVTNLLIKKLRSNFPNCQFKFIFVTLNVIVVHVYACIQNITQGLLMP